MATDLPATIMSIATLVTACGAVFLGYLNRKAIGVVHIATNSMKDALVKQAGDIGVLEGHAAGVADEKASVKATDEAFEEGHATGMADAKELGGTDKAPIAVEVKNPDPIHVEVANGPYEHT